MARMGVPADVDDGPQASDPVGDRQAWNLLFVVVAIILVGMSAMALLAFDSDLPLP